MFEKVVAVMLAMHMAPLLIQAQIVPSEKAAAPIIRQQLLYQECPQIYGLDGFGLVLMDIHELKSPCFLNAEKVEISDSIINVNNTVLYIISKNIKIKNSKFYGHNQSILIIGDNVEITHNEFIGKNRTYEVTAVNIKSMLNAHKGHISKIIETGEYIRKSKNAHFGNDQHHMITGRAVSEVRDKYSKLLPEMLQADLLITKTGNVYDEFIIHRDTSISDGNNQTQIMHATRVKDRANFFCGDHQTHRETAENVTSTLNWYTGEDIVHTINGVAQKNDSF